MTVAALIVRRAESEEDFEAVRVIRNAGREWLADSRLISPEEQAVFRTTFPEPVWLYELDGEIVGWGLVKRGDDGLAYVSLAVHPDHLRQGIGTRIYRDLRGGWPDELWAICRAANNPSIRAALRAGFEITDRQVGVGLVALKAEPLP